MKANRPSQESFEELLSATARGSDPDERFVAALRQRLVDEGARLPGAQEYPARRPAGNAGLRRAASWGLALAGLAALVGLLVFSLRLLPQGPVAQGQVTASAVLPAVAPAIATPSSAPPPVGPLYTVQAGDTWAAIAAAFAVSEAELRAANPALNGGDLVVGQQLVIPAAEGTAPTPPASYTVQEGDTLAGIAAQFGLKEADLYAWNLDAGPVLYVGLVLRLSPPPLTPTPALPTLAPGSASGVLDPAARHEILVRSGPGSTFHWNARLPQGTRLILLGRSPQGDWLEVQAADRSRGWVASSQVVDLAPLGAQTIVALPATSPLQEPAADAPRLSPAACANPIDAPEFAMDYDRPARLIGGDTLQLGDFTFDFWLHCDSVFGSTGGDNMAALSEIAGLGIYGAWFYQGADQPGATLTYFGIQPYVSEYGGSSDMTAGSGSTLNQGLQFPLGVIPDWSQVERAPLQADMIVRTTDGQTTGVSLSFTLVRGADGFLPVDVQAAEWQGDLDALVAAAGKATPPLPLQDPGELYPVWKDAHDRLASWQAGLLDGPGWIHIVERRLDGRLVELVDEQWLQIDAQGWILASTYQQLDTNGNVLQQSYMKDGRHVNLTYGSDTPAGAPRQLDLAAGFTSDLLQALQRGLAVERSEIDLEGRPAVEYAWSETYAAPRIIDGKTIASHRRRLVLDRVSGAPWLNELTALDAQGQESVLWRILLDRLEHTVQAPAEVLELLDMESSGYQPAAPKGSPAPAGFDASALPLSLETIPGDDFTGPTFFYGDISAGGYLLGRVDFGASPGGFCDRSADGSKLAFNHLVISNDSSGRETLRWLALSDVATVHDPAPELYLISKVSWSPQGSLAAFTACREGQQDCGLYLLDADTNAVRLLYAPHPALGVSALRPIWKPDGSQVALFSATTDQDTATLYVIDVTTGESAAGLIFDVDAWQGVGDVPLRSWYPDLGKAIARGQDGGGCFIDR